MAPLTITATISCTLIIVYTISVYCDSHLLVYTNNSVYYPGGVAHLKMSHSDWQHKHTCHLFYSFNLSGDDFFGRHGESTVFFLCLHGDDFIVCMEMTFLAGMYYAGVEEKRGPTPGGEVSPQIDHSD